MTWLLIWKKLPILLMERKKFQIMYFTVIEVLMISTQQSAYPLPKDRGQMPYLLFTQFWKRWTA